MNNVATFDLAEAGVSKSNWKSGLLRKGGKTGAPLLPCVTNTTAIFSHDEAWRNVLAFDEFIGDIVTLKPPPWPDDVAPDKASLGVWTDFDTDQANNWLGREYGITAHPSVIRSGLHIAAMRRMIDPLRDSLTELKWDRKSRIDKLFITYGGADDTPYVRAVGKNFMIGAVARVLSPGCKLDTMPILEGDQGIGKSSFIRVLASEPYYLEATLEMGTKDSYQMLRRKWIIELGELDALSRSEVARTKQYITQQVDTYRPSFGRATIDFKRRVAFIGTINPNGGGYLKDETGARRFQPIFMRYVDLAALARDRAQLWAEAVFRYRKCEKWHFADPKLLAAARQEAEDRRQQDPWEPLVAAWLATRKASVIIRGVTTHSILSDCLQIPVERQTRSEEMRCATILRVCGWTDVYRDSTQPDRPRYYRRPNAPKIIAGGQKDGTPTKDRRGSGRVWGPEDVSRTVSRPTSDEGLRKAIRRSGLRDSSRKDP